MDEPDRLQGEQFDWVPDALVEDAVEAWHVMPRPLGLDDQMRFVLAAVLPAYRQLVLMAAISPDSMDPMSAENFKIIDKKYGSLHRAVEGVTRSIAEVLTAVEDHDRRIHRLERDHG